MFIKIPSIFTLRKYTRLMRGGVGGVEKEARQLENKEQTKNSAGTAD